MDPFLWFAKREVNICPPHFVKCNTPLSQKSLFWVKTKTHGRYCIVHSIVGDESDLLVSYEGNIVYFEDPKEAMFYELRWSGNK